MLKLEGMEIAGFKSFRERVQVRFPEGLTGIVGPNGCGKSNLLDAMCWALGEQSAGALRGQRMGDLIFNGTRHRKPSPLAEVSLRLAGTNGSGGENLHLTRRLYQSGDSEYLLNGEKVRLKDISEQLLGTGIGVRAYSIIHQGKVEEILSSKPEERRILIEEAAGITRYRAKRRSATLKLERTEQDLLRVADILREVERQRNSLKRQVGAARRFRVHKNRERFLHRLELGYRHRTLVHALQQNQSELSEAQTAHAEAASRTAETEALLEQLRVRLEEETRILEELRDAQHRREREIDRLEHQIATARERCTETEDAAQDRRGQLAAIEKTIEEGRTGIERLTEGFEGSEAALQTAREELDRVETEFRQAREALEELETESEAGREAVFEATAAISDHRNAAEAANRAAERSRAVVARYRGQAEEVGREASRASESAASLQFGLTAARETLQSSREALDGARQALQSKREELDQVRLAREEALRGESREESRLSLLQKLDEEGERCAGGVQALLEAARDAGVPGFRGLVADHLEAESGVEEAAEAVLRERLQWIVVAGREAAARASERVRAGEAGGASFLFEAWPAPGTVVLPAPEGTRPLADCVRSDDDAVRSALSDWLTNAFVAAGPGEAARLSAEHPHAIFVTADGSCWGPGPVLHQQGAGSEGGVLRLKREIREASEAWESASHRRAGEEARCQRLESELESYRRVEEEREEKVREAERAVVAAEHQVAAATEQRDRLQRQHRMLLEEAGRAENEVREHAQEAGEATDLVREAEEQREAESARLEELREKSERAVSRISALEHELRRLREVLADRRETREAARLRLEHARHRQEEATAQGQRLTSEIDGLAQRRTALLQEIDTAEETLAESLQEREGARGSLRKAEEAVTGTRLRLQKEEAEIKVRREGQERAARSVSEVEVRLAGLNADREHLRRECRTDLGEEIESVASAPPPIEEEVDPETGKATRTRAVEWDSGELPDLDAVSRELTEVRRKLERIGSVNLVAIEEFEELDERWTFLKEQQADIQESVDSLRNTIREIDQICRERFTEAFTRVRAFFIENFRILFKGGEADIRLLESEEEEDNIMAAGIEIFAQPPGKKLQNIRLMSGGEKALSAIALIFALFRYKPSPFCVLDEVDAPLDDVNLTRFLGLLESLEEETQFIIITHNKLSMERADILYGVTMEEPGCSKLVSVDFRDIEKEELAGTESLSSGNGDGAGAEGNGAASGNGSGEHELAASPGQGETESEGTGPSAN